jgi:cell shape-determining protein MreC
MMTTKTIDEFMSEFTDLAKENVKLKDELGELIGEVEELRAFKANYTKPHYTRDVKVCDCW